jgi:hypothetical protein
MLYYTCILYDDLTIVAFVYLDKGDKSSGGRFSSSPIEPMMSSRKENDDMISNGKKNPKEKMASTSKNNSYH